MPTMGFAAAIRAPRLAWSTSLRRCPPPTLDLDINGLRVQGINTVAPISINLAASKSDLNGHTLVGTYLDKARAAREKVNGMVQAVLGTL